MPARLFTFASPIHEKSLLRSKRDSAVLTSHFMETDFTSDGPIQVHLFFLPPMRTLIYDICTSLENFLYAYSNQRNGTYRPAFDPSVI